MEDPRQKMIEEDEAHVVSDEELLIEAARRGNEDLLDEVLGRGQVNINYIDGLSNTALHYAASGGHLDCLVSILDQGGDSVASWANFQGETPLHRAVIGDSVLCAQALLAAGACAKDRTVEGKRPMDFVVSAEMGTVLSEYLNVDKAGSLENLVASDSEDE